MARSGKVRGVGPWARVGARVGQRRERLRIGQEKAAALAGISRETWGKIEAGEQQSYRQSTLIGVCTAIRWAPESIALILDGREPVELPDEEPDLASRVADLERSMEWLVEELAAIRRAATGENGPRPRAGRPAPPTG